MHGVRQAQSDRETEKDDYILEQYIYACKKRTDNDFFEPNISRSDLSIV